MLGAFAGLLTPFNVLIFQSAGMDCWCDFVFDLYGIDMYWGFGCRSFAQNFKTSWSVDFL